MLYWGSGESKAFQSRISEINNNNKEHPYEYDTGIQNLVEYFKMNKFKQKDTYISVRCQKS